MRDHTGRLLFSSLLCAIFAVAIGSRLAYGQQPRQPMKEATAVNREARTDAYGDTLPPGALARMGTLREFIGEGSSRIVFSAHGTYVTASSGYGLPRARLRDPMTGRVVREFPELDRTGIGVGQVAISPDEMRIAVSDYQTVWVGRIDTGQRIHVFPGHEYIQQVAFAPDGNTLLVRDAGRVLFWDIAAGKQTQWPGMAGWRPIAFTHVFDVLGMRRAGKESLLHFAVSGRELRCDLEPPEDGHRSFPLFLSPNREVLAFYEWNDAIRLWNLTTGKPMPSMPVYQKPPGMSIEYMENQVAFSPDAKLLAAADTLTSLSLWQLDTGRLYRRFHDVQVEMGFAFAHDGKRVVTGGRRFHYWDVAQGKEIPRYPDQPPVVAVAFTPDGKSLVSAAGLSLRLSDAATGRDLQRFQGPHRFRDLIYPKDSRTGQEDRSARGRRPTIQSMAITRDGKIVASGAEDGSLWLWDLVTGREIRQIEGHRNPISVIAFAPDGQIFAAASGGMVWLGDTNTGREIRRFPRVFGGAVYSLAFSRDGQRLASCHARGASLGDLGAKSAGKDLADTGSSWCLAFAPNGKTLAVAGTDGAVRLFEYPTGQVVRKFAPPSTRAFQRTGIRALILTPDGQTLISAGDDNTVKLWDLKSGRERGRLKGHAGGVSSLAIAPDGKTLASGSDDGTVVIWDLTSAEHAFQAAKP